MLNLIRNDDEYQQWLEIAIDIENICATIDYRPIGLFEILQYRLQIIREAIRLYDEMRK